MARIRLVKNSAGFRELLRDPGVRAELARHADRVAAAARAGAPVASGAYKASIRRESATTDRAVERVVADVPYALAVEAKTGNLARTLGQAGG